MFITGKIISRAGKEGGNHEDCWNIADEITSHIEPRNMTNMEDLQVVEEGRKKLRTKRKQFLLLCQDTGMQNQAVEQLRPPNYRGLMNFKHMKKLLMTVKKKRRQKRTAWYQLGSGRKNQRW